MTPKYFGSSHKTMLSSVASNLKTDNWTISCARKEVTFCIKTLCGIGIGWFQLVCELSSGITVNCVSVATRALMELGLEWYICLGNPVICPCNRVLAFYGNVQGQIPITGVWSNQNWILDKRKMVPGMLVAGRGKV